MTFWEKIKHLFEGHHNNSVILSYPDCKCFVRGCVGCYTIREWQTCPEHVGNDALIRKMERWLLRAKAKDMIFRALQKERANDNS